MLDVCRFSSSFGYTISDILPSQKKMEAGRQVGSAIFLKLESRTGDTFEALSKAVFGLCFNALIYFIILVYLLACEIYSS